MKRSQHSQIILVTHIYTQCVCVCVYLYRCSAAQADCTVTGLVAQMCREATHSLQCVPDVRQEAAQRPLQVDLRTTLHRLQADAAQRVAAQDGG